MFNVVLSSLVKYHTPDAAASVEALMVHETGTCVIGLLHKAEE